MSFDHYDHLINVALAIPVHNWIISDLPMNNVFCLCKFFPSIERPWTNSQAQASILFRQYGELINTCFFGSSGLAGVDKLVIPHQVEQKSSSHFSGESRTNLFLGMA